jgi:hypothetical protein
MATVEANDLVWMLVGAGAKLQEPGAARWGIGLCQLR